MDILDLLPQVSVPTLILHAREDAAVPLSQGHVLAAEVPHAQFIALDSRNHILLEHEPAWACFREAVLDFMEVEESTAGHEDRPQPRVEHLRQAGRVDARAGDRLRARPRVQINGVGGHF